MNSLDFMDMALDTAYDRIGTTSPNPAVGALIVRAGKPLACGGTCAYGCDHAEVMAINSALETCGGSGLSGCEIYVTLEPCSHWGKTPPCADAIIRNGIRKVYIPLLDPNPVVPEMALGA
jgi:diaminohydroxyphosphoribosylaminopyrimidine deaminase/5-amino-6-(5-phosphoribosylamino)uracil reductase